MKTARTKWNSLGRLVLILLVVVGVLVGPSAGVCTGFSLTWSMANEGLDGAAVTALTRSQVVLAGTQSGGVYAWQSSTGAWRLSSSGIDSRSDDNGTVYPTIQALSTEASDPTHVVAGTSAGLYVSYNSGGSWQRVGGAVLPADCRSIATDRRVPGTLLVGTAKGVYMSRDDGQTWAKGGDGMLDQPILCVAFDRARAEYAFAGTSEGLYRTLDAGATWRRLNKPLLDQVSAIMQDETNPSILTAGTTYGIMRSIDGGTNWQIAPGGTGYGAVILFGQWNDPQAVVAICRKGLLVSENGGDSWSQLQGYSIPPADLLSGLADRSDFAPVVGSADGVYFITQGTSRLSSSGLGSPASGAVTYSSIANRFYVVRGTRIYSSTGPGVWVQVGRDVGNAGIHALISHATQRGVLFAGSDLGLLRSNDGGSTWSIQPVSGVSGRVVGLAMNPSGTLLLAATDLGIYGGDPSTPTAWKRFSGSPATVSSLAWSALFSARVYALASGHIYVSNDQGLHWSVWSIDLSSLGVRVCTVHATSASSEEVLLGTADGVWRLPGESAVPARYGSGLEGIPVVGICSQSTAEGGVMAGTPKGVFVVATKADVTAPLIIVDSPLAGTTLHTAVCDVRGTVTDDESGLRALSVGGSGTPVGVDGRFSATVTLGRGSDTIEVHAVDWAGNVASRTISVTVNPVATLVLYVGRGQMEADGRVIALDSPPVIISGRTLVPIRSIIETLGGQVSWDAGSQRVDIMLGGHRVSLWIGKRMAEVDGRPVAIDENAVVVPAIMGGRTMLPLRFVVQSVGAEVAWDGALQRITIRYPGSQP